MVRNYKKKGTRNGEVNEEAMSSAISDVLEHKLSFRKSAAKYGVNAQTLKSRINKRCKLKESGSESRIFHSKFASCQVFTAEEEGLLNKYIFDSSKIHFGLTCKQVRRLAYEFANANNIKHPSSWVTNKMAGPDWLASFRKRNSNLSLRKPKNMIAARSFGFNKTAVNEFFQNLETAYSEYNFTANRIFNFEESSISTLVNSPKVLADKNQEQVDQIIFTERGELVTFGGIIAANGNTLPPLFVFPSLHSEDHFIDGAPEGSLCIASRSGWMNSDIFIEVLKHIQKFTLCSKANPILILSDNHESHISINAINYCWDNGIVYLSFPPHTTHHLQPLDIGVFGPFKSKLRKSFSEWHVSNPGKTINAYNIPRLVKYPYLKTFNPRNITKAFEKTGIWPFKKLIFIDEDITPIQVYNANPATTSNESTDADEFVEVPAITPSTSSRDMSSTLLSHQHTTLSIVNDDSLLSISKVSTIPAILRPLPKAVRTKLIKKATPEKHKIEERDKNREINKKETVQKRRAIEMKRALSLIHVVSLKSTINKNSIIEESDISSNETDISVRESSSSPFDDIEEFEENEFEEFLTVDPEHLKDGAFVLVKFEKKKSIMYYIGKIIEHYSSTEVKISFLEKKPGSSVTFVFPDVKDERSVDLSDIVMVLPDPKLAITPRTDHIFVFKYL